MVEIKVYLNEIEKLNSFANTTSTFESDIDAVRGHYVIDAKSIMGLMSLDLSKPLDIILHSDDEGEIARFNEVMKKYQQTS